MQLFCLPRGERSSERRRFSPDSVLPQLPNMRDLRPFPTKENVVYNGHTDKIRTLSVDPSGQWMATGSDDKTVRLWEVQTGRCFYTWKLPNIIHWVEFNPNPAINLLAVCSEEMIYLIEPPHIGTEATHAATQASELMVLWIALPHNYQY